jgi:phosphoenolpyruvate synthase/pyruvate phosphate dikinase
LATDITDKSKKFLDFLAKKKDELCAIRLIPTDAKLQKLRLRGETVEKSVNWFFEQQIDPKLYRVDFVPHSDVSDWSTIFVVNKNGIFGEIINDSHSHLTQGFYEKSKPIIFGYDFKKWSLSEENEEALNHLKRVIKNIKVDDVKKRKVIEKEFGAKFYKNYIGGYWETVSSQEFGLWFIDYNRILGEMYGDYKWQKSDGFKNIEKTFINGSPASKGKVSGVVKVIKAETVMEISAINEGTVIVCDVTTPDFVPLMKKCVAIVTDRGGILSHAGIVARELGLPCIVGTEKSTTILSDGMTVIVDADNGVIEIE